MTTQKRCAVYCRRSMDQFGTALTSVEMQSKMCASFIASQAHRGWGTEPSSYFDEGVSGATLLRPGLQGMLRDIELGLIDVVVIYKIDRLTRTLLDFVRLLDLFDQNGVDFVCVTQNFDTSDSTGRLILNILLTFAQFEREITGDRLRDKFATMKSLGLFVGGHPAYGYDLIGKKLVPNETEAKVVRWLFRSYLKEKSYLVLQKRMKEMGVMRRERTSRRGRTIVSRPIHASAVWHMLGNPIYVGDVRHKGQVFPGEHQGLVGRQLWGQVQLLREQRARRKVVEIYKTDLLRGLFYDSFGRLMGILRDWRQEDRPYRYYISNQSEWGRRHNVKRFRTRADDLEKLVMTGLISFLSDRERLRSLLFRAGISPPSKIRTLSAAGPRLAKTLQDCSARQKISALKALIEQGQISFESTCVSLRTNEVIRLLIWDGVGYFRGCPEDWNRHPERELLTLPASVLRMKRSLSLPAVRSDERRTPDYRLKNLLIRARKARLLLEDERSVSIATIAREVRCGPTQFARLIRINYLAPDIVASILDGRQPKTLTSRTLLNCDLPMDWALQRQLLGMPSQPDDLSGYTPY